MSEHRLETIYVRFDGISLTVRFRCQTRGKEFTPDPTDDGYEWVLVPDQP